MQLGFYIKRTMSCDNPGLVVLYYYLNCNAFNVVDPAELLMERGAEEEYGSWLENKLKCGYLFKKHARRERRLDSKSTVDDDREDLLLVSERSLSEVKVTPNLIELSKIIACGELDYLLSQISNYSSWELIKTTESAQKAKPYSLKAYVQGNKKFRLEIQLYSEDLRETANLFIDPNKHAIWNNIQRTVIYKNDMLEVIHSLHASKAQDAFTEHIMEYEFEELFSLEGESLFICLLYTSDAADE
eukprot:TRINITY_DN4014_c0_g1_i18.p1 TRINITY_DN4014_c0_g1~~TRINITY_DN4014_c0_g1_i18.p1  ORF type:complete len:244 (+),score=63.26 TRINITY_DN4014_c0_g1_i18:110-841(+)